MRDMVDVRNGVNKTGFFLTLNQSLGFFYCSKIGRANF